MENKTGKYFKYAIGEIILVVIGILIALQINNWNENRLKNNSVKTYLTNLIQDLKEDQNKLDQMYAWQSFKYYSMQYLLKIEGSDIYDPIADDKKDIPSFGNNYIWKAEIPEVFNKEFIQLAFKSSHKDIIFTPTKSTVDELKSTGMYSNMNPELKTEINLYYQTWESGFNGKVQLLAMEWQTSLAEEGFITSDTYKLPDPISLLKNNPKRIGLLKRMIRESGWSTITVIKMKRINEELTDRLEKEINTL